MIWVQWCGSLNIFWHCCPLGLEWKLTFSSPVYTTEFSKFVSILSAALEYHHLFSSVQFSRSVVSDSSIPWIAACQASLSITNFQSSPKLTSIESVMPSSHLILCRPLLLLPPIPPSIRVFSSESTLHMRRPKYWSFSFSIIPSKEQPGLISFRMDWLDLLTTPFQLLFLLTYLYVNHYRCSFFQNNLCYFACSFQNYF